MTVIFGFIFMFSEVSLKKQVSITMESNCWIPTKDFSEIPSENKYF